MKRIIFLAVTVASLFAATTIKSQTFHFQMKTAKAPGSEIKLGLTVRNTGTPQIAVDWGDGTQVPYSSVSTTTNTITTLDGIVGATQTITIYTYGTNKLAYLRCDNTELTYLDLSGVAEATNNLLQLYVINSNKISKLIGLEKHRLSLQTCQFIEGQNSFFNDVDFLGFEDHTAFTILSLRNQGIKSAKKLNLLKCPNLREFYSN